MLIYNITTKVDWLIHDQWLKWMKTVHVPEVMATGCFQQQQMVRLLETDETEGATYAMQYYAATEADYHRYTELFAPALRQQILGKWGARVISFRSLMEVVN
ncbi:hypothetical protein HNQ91_005439 [Filimonas zeae]|uniref:DUF4286 family protein n=1 Tax=Filimonas zeae TaxID=1737353 RepID=A0A917MYZ6_9BACT|nr:DUF4286 family protein [Filimonas zeae]MDR6342355.1 hypothetical protein [Filimonas zeae]GGH81000.1 hypothetical protein GCM10011379_52710 [Filimonas zeae]